MNPNSIIEGIREFLLGCPLLDKKNIRVNFLGSETVEYTIDEVPGTSVLTQYTDGSSRRSVLFLFATRSPYSRDAVQNMIVSGFFEDFSDWIEKQTSVGILPTLPTGCTAQTIKAITNGYAFDADEQGKVQRYQIQCRLTYFKEAF